jgi:hypothetical protein
MRVGVFPVPYTAAIPNRVFNVKDIEVTIFSLLLKMGTRPISPTVSTQNTECY